MKDFFKYVFATIVGIILSATILFFVSTLILFSVAFSSQSTTIIPDNAVMMLNLDGKLVERSTDDTMNQITKMFTSGSSMNSGDTYGLDDILSSIGKAKDNDKIKGIYIQASSLAAMPASIEEIRNALIKFKESGKFIVAYGDSYTQSLYYLSSIADKVLLNPKGAVAWKGLASQIPLYKGLLNKVGVEYQIFKVGTYKSAVEPFINEHISDANREQVNAYLGSIWNEMNNGISESRTSLTTDVLNDAANSMMELRPAEDAVALQLVDTLIYKNDVRDYLKTFVGIDKDEHLNIVGLSDMVNLKKDVPRDKSGNKIAVYYMYGEIDGASLLPGSDEGIQSKEVIRDLRKLAEDKNVKAVVLRVNSPGGSAFGSEQIWYAVSQLKEKKPVIVSMGDYAASGGYYISCNADVIVADPTTLTGSIGIFGMVPNFEKLTNKIGVNFDVVKTNDLADMGNATRPMNSTEKALLQKEVERGYDLFLTRCSEGRGIDKSSLDEIAQGRVWTGVMAQEIGLVDVLGGLDDALRIAIEHADVESYTVVSLPKKDSFFESLMKDTPTNYVKSAVLKENLGEYYQTFNMLNKLKNADRIQARVPYEMIIE